MVQALRWRWRLLWTILRTSLIDYSRMRSVREICLCAFVYMHTCVWPFSYLIVWLCDSCDFPGLNQWNTWNPKKHPDSIHSHSRCILSHCPTGTGIEWFVGIHFALIGLNTIPVITAIMHTGLECQACREMAGLWAAEMACLVSFTSFCVIWDTFIRNTRVLECVSQ